ncbi:unnamed protein product, partial [Rotaria socialis]
CIASSTSSSSKQTSSSTFGSSTSKIIPSSSSSPKEANPCSNTTTKKKTKSKSKTQIINCSSGLQNNDNESDDEAHYDLQTCIEESGGLVQFLSTPCMILYKNNLQNQSDLENYVLQHLSSYKGNVCEFAGIKGTDAMKNKINEFYHRNQKTSMKSTILFKGHASKTTATQQMFLSNGHLYLYVDAVMKNKTSRNKRKKVCVGSARGGDREECHGKNGDRGIKGGISASTKYSQNETNGNGNNEGKKIDIENVNNGSETELEGDEGESEPCVNEDENSEEETSHINSMLLKQLLFKFQKTGDQSMNLFTCLRLASTGRTRRGSINWKGGSKNTGVYLLYNKKKEVQECVNNVLSYAREHGTLLSGAQLKTILDIENVEITKDRANGLVQVISKSVDIVTNPHFVPPTTKKPVYEYYGKNYELAMIHPIKPIPIPSAILAKYQKETNKKEKVDGGNKSGNEEESSVEMMEGKYSETYTAEDDDAMEVDDNKTNEENDTNSGDDEDENEKLNELKNNSSEGSSNNVKSGVDNKNQTVIDNSVLDEESIENNIILLPSNHLEVVSHENDPSNNNVVNISKQIEQQVENVITRSSSPITGKNDSSITIDIRSRSSLQTVSSSVTCFNDLSVLNRNSKLTTTLPSTTTPSLDSTDSARNPMSLTDTSHSNTVQRSSSVESTSKITLSLEQPVTPSQPKQKNSHVKKIIARQITPKNALHIPSSSSHLYCPALPFQHQYQYSHSSEPQPQTLSPDEWSLIISLRMMKNFNVSPPFQPPPLSSYRQAGGATSYQAISSYQTCHQMQPSTYYAPAPPYYHHPYAGSATVSQQFLNAQEIQYSTTQAQASFTTPVSSLPPSTTVALSSPLFTRTASPSSSFITPSFLSSSPPTISVQGKVALIPESPQTQSGHQNHSPKPQLQSPSPSSSNSTPVTIISSAQQQKQKSPIQHLLVPDRHQSSKSQLPTTYQYDSSRTRPTVQLIDPTKPYKIGDTIKVGGRTLQSDASSMKYWLEDDMAITETTSGGHILNMGGYSYFAKSYANNFTKWECEHRRHHRCSSIVIRSSDPTVKNYFRIYSIQGEHIHESKPDNVEIRRFKQRVRDRCRQELSSPRTIYEDELMKGKYSAEMLVVLPTFYNMQAQLYRIRQEHLPTSPIDSKFALHPGFTTTDQGNRFLLYDSNVVQVPYASAPPEVGRLLIYASDLQLDILSKSNRIGSDGTFETAAQISHQNYIIIGEVEEKHPVPLIFCLCEHKNYETYKLIIKVLKTAVINLKLDLKPVYWMSDYESALTKAIKEELPNTQLLGCAFHFSQAIYRNIQGKGLQDAYQNLEVVRQVLRQIMALAFVPSDQITRVYYDVIKPQLNNVPAKPISLRHNLRDFFKYFESFWLRKTNQFCVFNQSTRTNNGLEGYNNKMCVQLSAHPHLYRLIVWFEKEELLVQQLVMKISSDIPVHKRKQTAITILINDSLQTLWDNYNAGNLSAKDLLLESSKWVAKKVS